MAYIKLPKPAGKIPINFISGLSPAGTSPLEHATEFVPFYCWVAFYSVAVPRFVHLFMNWTFESRFWSTMTKATVNSYVLVGVCGGRFFFFFFEMYLGVGLLGPISVYLSIWVTLCCSAKLFSNMTISFCIPTSSNTRISVVLHACQHLVFSVIKIIAQWFSTIFISWHT